MGEGSRNYAIYYGFSMVLYLVIASIAFALVATVAPNCQVKCPTLIAGPTDGSQPNYKACLCNVSGIIAQADGYISNYNQSQYDRWFQITQATLEVGRSCYICPSDSNPTIYEACPNYDLCTQSNMLGFRTARNLSTCNTQTDQTADAGILVSSTVTNRGLVLSIFYTVATLYLVLMIGALLCFIGYYMFKDKYGSDWSHLTRMERYFGIACKVAPGITRVFNFIVLFFILVSIISEFAYEVCKYDTNDFGDIVFYPTVAGYLTFVGIAWLFMCIFGIFFDRVVPKDISFYTPEYPREKNDTLIKTCCCSFCYVITNYGP